MLTETQGQGHIQQDARTDNLPEPQTTADDQAECGVESRPCASSAYVTATYVTGHRSFWLLTENALSNIETSASQLKAAASKTEAHQRIDALQALGLADLFVPPTPKSFLPPGQQSEWEQLLEKNQGDQESIDKLDQEIVEAERRYKDKARALKADVDYYVRQMPLHHNWRRERDEKEQAQHDLHNAIGERNERIEALSDIGTNAAKAAGFIVSGGELFSPKQIELKALLDDYDEQRQAFEEDSLPNADQTAIFLNTCRYNRELMAYEWRRSVPDIEQIEQYLTELDRLEGAMRPYAETVLALANVGVAMPEYALANGDSVEQGIEELAHHRQLDFRIKHLTEKLQEAADHWLGVLANQGPVPSAALMNYRKQIETCLSEQTVLRRKAEQNAKKLEPARLFVWNTADYEKRPFKALVKPGIPLREFSRPTSTVAVEHFSILDLGGAGKHFKNHPLPEHPEYQNQPATAIAASLKAAQRPGNDQQLETLLTDLGCKKMPMQAAWFDNNGIFAPDAFFEAIKGEGVRDLEGADARKAWGDQLKSLIFESNAKCHIMLFDDSYTAQFARLVLSGIPGELGDALSDGARVEVLTGLDGGKRELKGEFSGAEGKVGLTLGSATVGANLAFYQGQVDILDLKLPEPSEAEAVTVPYRNSEGNQAEMDLGRFHCAISAKCWGFVGARIALTRAIGVEAVRGKGIQITGVDQQARTVQGAELDAFAGGQAGLMAQGELFWAVPRQLRQTEQWRNLGEQMPEWSSLGLLRGELVAAYGAGATGDIMLGLYGGRLTLYVKGHTVAGLGGGLSLGFDIGFEAVPLWIRMLQEGLRDNGYRKIEWIQPDAFEYLSWLSNLFLTTALDISFLAARGYDFVETAFRRLNASERAGMVALRITDAIDKYERGVESAAPNSIAYEEYQAWFQRLQPEAIGPLLNHLVAAPDEIMFRGQRLSETVVLVLQRRTVTQCLTWMKQAEMLNPQSYRQSEPNTIQRQFTEALERMNMQGYKPAANPDNTACSNLERLDKFMGHGRNERSAEYMDYRAVRNPLAHHLSERI